jgi:hypothetical protein
MQTFNLPHEVYCEASGTCACTEQAVITSVVSEVDKERHPVQTQKRICSSFNVRYGERMQIGDGCKVHKAALKCPEVEAAIQCKPARLMIVPS